MPDMDFGSTINHRVPTANVAQGLAYPHRITPMELQKTPTDASFEFSGVSFSSASPASIIFSDGQLRAHHFPVMVRSSASLSNALPVMSSSSTSSSKTASPERKKRVTFAAAGVDGKTATSDTAWKRKVGLLGCMGSACGPSGDGVVEPARVGNPRSSSDIHV